MDLLPTKQIYDLLKTIDDVEVYQARPEIIENLPTITFFMLDISPQYILNRSIADANYTVQVDIWTQTPQEGKDFLIQVEQKLITANYRLTGVVQIQEPDRSSHLACTFVY
jgi:hypothetical protein